MSGPARALLPDGRRWHFQHGPIDLIVETFGTEADRAAAHAAGWARFRTILGELVAELPALRHRAGPGAPQVTGAVARRMAAAVRPHAAQGFVTPMAAVAGAVADAVLTAMLAAARLERAYVNNGGDAALFLSPRTSLRVAMPGFGGNAEISHASTVRGIATSGRGGRSHSLGIADAVTVLAANAAAADAAATLIANAVDLPGHPAIARRPANTLDLDSDLGARPVTTGVGALGPAEIDRALAAGLERAQEMQAAGLIAAAALRLGARVMTAGDSRLARGPGSGPGQRDAGAPARYALTR